MKKKINSANHRGGPISFLPTKKLCVIQLKFNDNQLIMQTTKTVIPMFFCPIYNVLVVLSTNNVHLGSRVVPSLPTTFSLS